jgi:omega-amidase
MRIAIVQSDIAAGDPAANIDKIERLISNAALCDIIILPETFTTGFTPSDSGLSVQYAAEAIRWMKKTAIEKKSAVCGTMFIREEDRVYNSFLFITPDGEQWSYKKRHLFLGDEKNSITPGSESVIVPFRGWRINLMICYDLRFPVWSRNRGDYDLLIYSANWPEPRREAWITLLKARAIENQSYVAGVNRVGSDSNGVKFAGDSVIIDPYGREILAIEPHTEGSASQVLSLEKLEYFRKSFPAWLDRDDFKIIT